MFRERDETATTAAATSSFSDVFIATVTASHYAIAGCTAELEDDNIMNPMVDVGASSSSSSNNANTIKESDSSSGGISIAGVVFLSLAVIMVAISGNLHTKRHLHIRSSKKIHTMPTINSNNSRIHREIA